MLLKCVCISPYRKWTKTEMVWSLLMNSSFLVKRYFFLDNHSTEFPSFPTFVVIIKPFTSNSTARGAFTGLHCPLVVGIVHQPTLVWIVFSSQLFIFLSFLCRMRTSWGLFNSLKMSFKHLRTMQRLGKRQMREQNKEKWNKEGYEMGPFYICNCTIVLLP